MPQGMLNITRPGPAGGSKLAAIVAELADKAGVDPSRLRTLEQLVTDDQFGVQGRFDNEINRLWEHVSGLLSEDRINALIDTRVRTNRPLTDLDVYYTWHHIDGQAFATAGTSTTSARISSHNIPGRLLVERLVWQGNSTAGDLQIAIYDNTGAIKVGTGTIHNVNGRGSFTVAPGVQLQAGTYYVASSSVILAGSGVWCTDPGPAQTGPVHRWGLMTVTAGVLPRAIDLKSITRAPIYPQPLIALCTAGYASDS